MTFEDSREWKMGDAAQQQWAWRVAHRKGFIVLPTYGMKDVAAETKAPMLFAADGLLIAPDLLLMKPDAQYWNEVKAKSVPGWYRILSRWEHGADKSLVDDYRTVQQRTGVPVYIIVRELASPIDADALSPLNGPSQWRVIALDNALRLGEHRPFWPGGKHSTAHGKRGEGGWLWPRNAMVRI